MFNNRNLKSKVEKSKNQGFPVTRSRKKERNARKLRNRMCDFENDHFVAYRNRDEPEKNFNYPKVISQSTYNREENRSSDEPSNDYSWMTKNSQVTNQLPSRLSILKSSYKCENETRTNQDFFEFSAFATQPTSRQITPKQLLLKQLSSKQLFSPLPKASSANQQFAAQLVDDKPFTDQPFGERVFKNQPCVIDPFLDPTFFNRPSESRPFASQTFVSELSASQPLANKHNTKRQLQNQHPKSQQFFNQPSTSKNFTNQPTVQQPAVIQQQSKSIFREVDELYSKFVINDSRQKTQKKARNENKPLENRKQVNNENGIKNSERRENFHDNDNAVENELQDSEDWNLSLDEDRFFSDFEREFVVEARVANYEDQSKKLRMEIAEKVRNVDDILKGKKSSTPTREIRSKKSNERTEQHREFLLTPSKYVYKTPENRRYRTPTLQCNNPALKPAVYDVSKCKKVLYSVDENLIQPGCNDMEFETTYLSPIASIQLEETGCSNMCSRNDFVLDANQIEKAAKFFRDNDMSPCYTYPSPKTEYMPVYTKYSNKLDVTFQKKNDGNKRAAVQDLGSKCTSRPHKFSRSIFQAAMSRENFEDNSNPFRLNGEVTSYPAECMGRAPEMYNCNFETEDEDLKILHNQFKFSLEDTSCDTTF